MKVHVIGCHGSVEPGYQTSCYQINDSFYIDAGSICSALTPQEQMSVTDVLITHPHLDHVKDLCFLIENTATEDRTPLTLHSTADILNDVHRHLFNNVIWPDFSQIAVGADKQRKLLHFNPLPTNLTRKIAGVQVKAFPVNHPGHAVGFLLDDGQSQILFTGDSGPCPLIWQTANQCPQLKAIFTEISFPSRLDDLARVSGHYTLQQLLQDLTQLQRPDVPIFISHFKPHFLAELLDEFNRYAPQRLRLMHESDEFDFN